MAKYIFKIINFKIIKKISFHLKFTALIAALTVLFPLQTYSQENNFQVLHLDSYHCGLVWSDRLQEGIKNALPPDIELFTEYMDAKRYGGVEYFEMLAEIFNTKYQGRHIDAIIVSDDDAFQFMLRYHEILFPQVPVVFCGVNVFDEEMVRGRPWITGVPEYSEVEESLGTALNIHPGTREVVAIVDKTTNGQNHKKRLAQFISSTWPNVTIRFIGEEHTVEEVTNVLSKLNDKAIVYYSDFFIDAKGNALDPIKVVPWLSKNSTRPIYAHGEIYLGLGIVGGKLVSAYNQGNEAGRMTRLILDGQAVENIPPSLKSLNQNMYDHEQLVRFNIRENDLPRGSIIVNKKQSFLKRYANIIYPILIFIIIQTIFLILLLINIIKRRRIEKELQETAHHFSLIFRHSPEIFLVSTLDDGKYIEVNDGFERTFGYKREEIIGKTYLQVRLWDNINEREKVVEEVKKNGFVSGYEAAYLRKSGEKFLALFSAMPLTMGSQKYLLSMALDITERKNMEESLRKSQERYALAQKAANIGSWDWDIVTGKLTWSETIEPLFGFLPGEFIGSYDAFLQSIHPEDRQGLTNAVDKSLKDGKEYAYEHRIVWPNGTVRWMAETGDIIKDSSGRAIRMIGMVQDITVRKQAEIDLRAKSEEIDQFFSFSLDLLCIADEQGYFRRLNPEWTKTLGYPLEEILNRRFIEHVHPADVDATFTAMSELISKRSVYNFINRFRCKDGTYRWLEWRAYYTGEMIYAVARDITEHLHVQQIMQENQERYKALFGAISDSIYIFELFDDGVPGYFIEVNDEACRMLGYTKEEFMQMTIKDIDVLEPGIDTKPIFEKLLQGQVVRFEQKHIRRDGEIIPVEIQARLFIWKGKRVVSSTARDITERKKAENALFESEKLHRLLAENSLDIISLHDQTGNFLYVSSACRRILGYEPQDLMGKSSASIIHPEELPIALQTIREAISDRKESYSIQYRLKGKTGNWVWMETKGRVIFNEEGGLKEIQCVSRDITENKKTEKALRESEDRARTLSDSAFEGLMIHEEGIILEVNKAFVEMFWYERPEDLISKKVLDVLRFSPESHVIVQNQLRQRRGEIIELNTIGPDGKVRFLETQGRDVIYKGRKVRVVAMRDITARRQAELAIKESEERFRTIVDTAQDGVLVMDLITKRFIFANPKISKMLGYTIEELVKMGFSDIHYESSMPFVEAQFSRIISGETHLNEEIPVKRKDGTIFYADVNASIITFRGVKTIIGFFRDTTERKQAREELMQKNKELENYTYLVSHDLKEPIRSIHLFSQLIKRENWNQLDEGGRDYVNRVLNASNRLAQMISDLLMLSRVSRKDVTFQDVDLNSIIEAVKEDLSRQINERNAQVVSANLPVIKCQRVWIAEIFKNLISNGIKYNDKDRPLVEISYSDHDDHYEFSVSDNGIGIEKKYHEAVFDLFRRLHGRDEYEGTGAGLAIVKSIIAQHHGNIWIASSQPDKGTNFKFSIPKNL